jgi:hypothetical protein
MHPSPADIALFTFAHLWMSQDAPDFVIIRFHAGPPYEDVAFKIVRACSAL